jgi:hypothetical protein
VDWACQTDEADRHHRVGLEFEDLTEGARKRIRYYLVDQFLRQYARHRQSA